ncbi:MAG: FAD-binding oxidoreductase [Pseudomonadota bacterium]
MSEKEKPRKPNIGKIDTNSWYSSTPNRLLATLGALKGEINCDVCVIGGGFTGLSAALELSQNKYSVILLEAQEIAGSASGKNGGQLIRGYNHSPGTLASRYGSAAAKMMCNVTLEGLALVLDRIAKHDIKCDLKFGHVTAAMNDRHVSSLKEDIDEWAKIGHTDLKYLNRERIKDFVRSEKYAGGVFDPKGAHFHPLNYALGIAQTLQNIGCRIYDETPVLSIKQGATARIRTSHGIVNAKFVVLGGNVAFKGTEKLNRRVIPATAHMVATEPLDKTLVHAILPRNIAVTDARFIMDYYRLSSDNRLLFGAGDYSYNGVDYPGRAFSLRKKMADTFPGLAGVKIEHCWNGPLDITHNRMPGFGRLAPNIFYAHGYCGHGVILSNMAGKLIAEAVGGTAGRLDVFAKIRHIPFIGGDLVKRPLFVLGMTWYRLRDMM